MLQAVRRVEIGTIGACDGVAMSHKGMQYILPTREMIADDIEAMVEAHRLDGLVIICSCDKIVPGMLLGALRVNLPTVFVNEGLHSREECEKEILMEGNILTILLFSSQKER